MAKPKAKTRRKRVKDAGLDPEKVAEIVDLRTQGYSSRDIAEQLKMNVPEVIAHLECGLTDEYEEPPNFHIRLEIKRLQNLQNSMLVKATAGDQEATKLVISLEERIARAKLQLIPDMKELFGDLSLVRRANLTPGTVDKGGRPPHRPTQASIKTVEAMALAQQPLVVIARCLNISINTLREHYSFSLETARARLVSAASGTLSEAIFKGDVRAAIHVLDRVGPKDMRPPVTPTYDRAKVDPAGSDQKHEIVVHGGLPQGSTAANPGGDAQTKLDAEASPEAIAAHRLMAPPDETDK